MAMIDERMHGCLVLNDYKRALGMIQLYVQPPCNGSA